MATIKFNQSIAASIISGDGEGSIIMGSTLPPRSTTLAGSNTNGIAVLNIYKGIKETFPSFTDTNTRSADLLISFTLNSGNNSFEAFTLSTGYRYIIGKCLTPTAAVGSGTATWFLLKRNGTSSLTDKGALIGDVGLLGGTADLQLPDVNIVSGTYYRSNGFFINFNFTWTV